MREYGSEHPAIVIPDGYFDSLNNLDREILYLRSGREALLMAALAIRGVRLGVSEADPSEEISNTKPLTPNSIILVPAYCCWSMSAPFEKVGYKVVYYRLNEDLTVDLDYLKVLMGRVNADAILTMNYYGSAKTDDAVRLAKENGLVVIEDFSHCTFSIKRIFNPEMDIYVSSIRKSVGVCDGSIILSKEKMPEQYIQEEVKDFADKRFVAQSDKRHYTWSKDQEKKQEFLGTIRECEGIIDEFTTVRPISERAKEMLAQVNGEDVAYARRENMRHLWTRLNGNVRMVPGLERSFQKVGSSPFSLPILVDNRDVVQRKLAERGVYTQWLWPLSNDAMAVCPVSRLMNDRMLSVPIDQRLSWDDIEDMADIIISVVNA